MMKNLSGKIRLAATDLSNHLSCRHLTALDLSVARGQRAAPEWRAPNLAIIQELGLRHEASYLQWLRDQGKSFINLQEIKSEHQALAETVSCMEKGVEIIAQGSLSVLPWFGRPDVLAKVDKPSRLGGWSYEAYDCKLARETKAATILQLSLYSALLNEVQRTEPECMYVVPPGRNFEAETYRRAEYAAYYRYVRKRLENVSKDGAQENTYPEPCQHCDVCRWFSACDTQRRADDNLSLVAGIRRQQRDQLETWGAETVAALAVLPIPLKQRPSHGSRKAMETVREQARVQVQGRIEKKPVFEPILPVAEGVGFCRLPAPSPNDIFLDLEGDPFATESGLQYLFAFVFRDARGQLIYEKRWSLNRQQEKQAFEWLVDEIMRRRKADPSMHVFHFGAYEPAALKRLMGLHATREDEIDRLLRAGTLVDLHQTFKQAVRASVEEYSLKKAEVFYDYRRETPLDQSRVAMRFIEHRLELGWGDTELPDKMREIMEGYNREDCTSTAALRDWLEQQRTRIESETGVPRFVDRDEKPSEELNERQIRIAAMAERLTATIPADPQQRNKGQNAQWLLAQLLDWHGREFKAGCWEYYRLKDLSEEQLLDERAALAGLQFLQHLSVKGKIPTERYGFERQETEVRCGDALFTREGSFGTVEAIDVVNRTVDIKKMKKTAEVRPTAVFTWDRPYNTPAQSDSIFRIAEWVAKNGSDAPGTYRAARDLLLRHPPRLQNGEKLQQLASERPENTATRIAIALHHSTFAIQGPPGSGKTYTGARMICELVKRGKKIGVTAHSHKVIRKLLDDVVAAAREKDVARLRCMHHQPGGEESQGVPVASGPEDAIDALSTGAVNVLGGVSWLWSPEAAFEAVDYLFVDEAGQMSLADVLAVSQSAKNLVLLGDPQQLDRPLKGSHPEGAEKSALGHLLGDRRTIAADVGFLLPQTWRLHPEICKFTSSVFYEDKLTSNPLAQSRVMEGHKWITGAGLWFVPVVHDGNRNSSDEEVKVVKQIIEELLRPTVKWFYSAGNSRPLKPDDILVVAPYNAQVADLSAALPSISAGTVDKFQGQEAAVVIYSLTTSTPEDAPRGMEFLYSLNRLNVATSRAKTAVIIVGSPALFEPECHNPRQMQLANAFCQYLECASMHHL
jgi:predicted RecB family nuclease